jgi:hypothetical protein
MWLPLALHCFAVAASISQLPPLWVSCVDTRRLFVGLLTEVTGFRQTFRKRLLSLMPNVYRTTHPRSAEHELKSNQDYSLWTGSFLDPLNMSATTQLLL